MKSPRWLEGHVESLDIQPLGRYRSDCPVCGKKNTFSVSDDGMQRLWFCFHADCNVKGRTGITLTKDYAKHVLHKSNVTVKVSEPTTNFELPHTFVSLSRNLDAELYLKSVHAYPAYLAGHADIRYDFKKNRVVFVVKDGNKTVDAIGRSMDGSNPKWYRYGNSKKPFVVGNHDRAVIVEDCASACTISDKFTGVALLGTSLLQDYLPSLFHYQKIFVALDKDATDKAIDMVKTLCRIVPTKLMVLPRDLKNMTKDERNDFIRPYID
jgi:hypothetical protein|tara:strand:- start:292 stop:1092 length:801 start_codon:yes stop_codon:yes gene_type:complete